MGWFGRSGRSTASDALETIVGASSSFQGALRSDGGVRVDGAFEGQIEVAGNVVIGQGARVIGNVVARNLTVGGTLQGDADVAGQLQILSTGQLLGDITVASVMIDEGGVFQGTSRMRGFEQPALPAPRDANGGSRTGQTSSARSEDAPVRATASETVEVTARPAPSAPPAPAGQAPAPTKAGSRDEDDLGVELNMDIEPVIPDVVIEDVPESQQLGGHPTSRRRRGRNGQ